eukprot:sb/3474785/
MEPQSQRPFPRTNKIPSSIPYYSITPFLFAGSIHRRSLSYPPQDPLMGSTPVSKDLDATSDYNSSSGSLEALGEFEERIRSRLLQGVSDCLTETLDRTSTGLARIVDSAGDLEDPAMCHSTERFTKLLTSKVS